MSIWSVVLAAGHGARFGATKQFALLGQRRLIDWAVEVAVGACDATVVVLPDKAMWDARSVAVTVRGGATRSASVRAGLREVPADAEIVVIHDAAHPLATPTLFAAVVEAVRGGADGAVPALPLREVVARFDGGTMSDVPDRRGLQLVQMPQAFAADVLRTVHADEPDTVEDSALVASRGGKVVAVPGDPRNIHVTVRADLAIADRLIGAG
ncbi:MAG: 2-C-methyl-D-erythritol 4-phosphate cytidylyltransferase [Actinomycetota bacterium]|nr:2-C-methyl-D-erythritol 4-phosphate cytidylyltransferase [Actinomycetota bacterium]